MARHSSRLLRLVRWQYIRWGLAFPAFTLALWACNSHDLQVPKPNPQQETDFEIVVSPERAVDILFMIDNSPSMDPKQKALAKNFPEMIKALQKLEGGLPDVHVGVISSDMGAGATEAGGNCSVLLGNRGKLWGNDPTVEPTVDYNEFATVKHLKNAAGADGCGMNTGTRWIEDIQNDDGLTRQKNYQGELADVFSCLASGVGTLGCGYEHPLQAVRVAINPADNINPQNFKFLRPKAYLAVVLIADEDDCSADPNSDTNDGMFFPRTLGDTASLRCAARGHVCAGKAIPNYDPQLGYTGPDTGYEHDFADCDAKDADHTLNDKGKPVKPENFTDLPLIRIRDMVDSVNQVKERPSEQILVSGVIGWPAYKEDKDKKDISLNGFKYKIGKDDTSKPDEQKKLWDYMPICTVPGQTSSDGNIYKAYGGFRLKKFLDAFVHEDERNVFSICSTDNFPDAMTQIGNAIVRRLKPGCVEYPLIDRNKDVPEVQPECQVKDRISCNNPGVDKCLMSGYQEESLKECTDGEGKALDPTKAKDKDVQKTVSDDKRPCWYLVYDDNKDTGCPFAFKKQRITALRKGDGNAPPGTLLGMQCLTCASPPVKVDEEWVSACPALGTM
jgi:hypothetical protein